MFVPQLTSETTGYGLGFGVNRYRGHKTVQHMGAVYGFTTSMVVLPKERIGVIVLSNCDIAVAPVRRLAEAALDVLLEAVANEKVPAPRRPRSNCQRQRWSDSPDNTKRPATGRAAR